MHWNKCCRTVLLKWFFFFPLCESQPHKGHLTSKLKNRLKLRSYLLCNLLLVPFHLLPSPVYPTGLSSCFIPGFLAIFTLLLLNNNNNNVLLENCKSNKSAEKNSPIIELHSSDISERSNKSCCSMTTI